MQEKIYMINGGSTGGMSELAPEEFYLFRPANFPNLVSIGNPYAGFTIDALKTAFAGNIAADEPCLNIILNLHGHAPSKEGYYLQLTHMTRYTAGTTIEAGEFLHHLRDATEGRKLNIFSLCCYGANIHNYTDLLPKGSIVISISDANRERYTLDLFSHNMRHYLDVAQKHGSIYKYLLPISLLCRKFTSNIPVISFVDEQGTKTTIKLSEYTNSLLKKPPAEIDGLFANCRFSSLLPTEYLKALVISEQESSIEKFKVPRFTDLIQKTNAEAIEYLESKYFPPKSLPSLNIDRDRYTIEYSRLLTRRDDLKKQFSEEQLEEIARLESIISANKIHKDNEEFDKIDWDEYHKLYCKLKEFIEFVPLDWTIEDIASEEEAFTNMDIIGFHLPNTEKGREYGFGQIRPYDFNDPVNQAMPNDTALLGIAASNLVEELFAT